MSFKNSMPYLIAQRLGIAVFTLLVVAFAVFLATELLPGDVAEIMLGQAATPEAVAGLRAAMGLDEPAIWRFVDWLTGLATGDFGLSYVNKMPVADLIGARLISSLKLAGITTLVAVPVSLALGICAAMWRGSTFNARFAWRRFR